MALFLAATESAGAILSDAMLTIVIGLVVVFAVLLLLTWIFKAFGIVVGSLENKEEASETVVSAAPAAPAAAPVAAPAAVPADLGPVMSSAQVRNGIKPEETAVIAAAVAACMPAGQKYSITKIDRAE